MAPPPFVSFVMTVFNGEAYLADTVDAIRQVDYPAFEIVIIDDGSTDKTTAIAHRLTEVDKRVRFLTPGKLGRGAALNHGVSSARGPFIAINDVDDWPLPHRLSEAVPLLAEKEDLSFVASGHLPVTDTDWHQKTARVPLRSPHPPVPIVPARLYRSNYIAHSTILFRKRAWTAAEGYDESLSSCIDYDFYFRLLAQGPGVYLPEVAAFVRRENPTTFKAMSTWSYWRNLSRVRRTARRLCPIGPLARFCGLAFFLVIAKQVARAAVR